MFTLDHFWTSTRSSEGQLHLDDRTSSKLTGWVWELKHVSVDQGKPASRRNAPLRSGSDNRHGGPRRKEIV